MHGIKGKTIQGNFLLYNILGANVDVVEGEDLEASKSSSVHYSTITFFI